MIKGTGLNTFTEYFIFRNYFQVDQGRGMVQDDVIKNNYFFVTGQISVL